MEAGYSHIDTATVIGNEKVIGAALQECFALGKKREDVFITTKLWHMGFGDVNKTINTSL